MAAGCGRHLESSTGIPLWTTDDNRFKLCSTDARQQQMANVTNVTDVTNAQEQVEVIVSIVWLSPLTWKTNERHTRSERVCDRLQCLQTEDEKANIILLDSIRVTLHYTWLGTSWHTTCTSLHISAFSRVKQGPSVFIILSPYQYHTSTRLKLFTIGKRMAAAKRSRMVASCRYALPGILIIDDHWWSLMIIDHSPTNHLKVIESLFVWRGAKKPSPAMSNRLWIFRMPSWDTGAELVWPSAAVYL